MDAAKVFAHDFSTSMHWNAFYHWQSSFTNRILGLSAALLLPLYQIFVHGEWDMVVLAIQDMSQLRRFQKCHMQANLQEHL